jgi:hypothetical protein
MGVMLMLRLIVAVVVLTLLVVVVFGISGVLASAVGYPEKTHLFAILLIASVMIFSAAIVSAVNRGWNPFK